MTGVDAVFAVSVRGFWVIFVWSYKKLWKGYSIVLFAISHLILGFVLRMLSLVLWL